MRTIYCNISIFFATLVYVAINRCFPFFIPLHKKKQEKAETSRKEKLKEQEKLEEKQAERRAEEKERMELLISKGDSAEEVISKLGNGEVDVVSEKMLDGITSVGFDVKA